MCEPVNHLGNYYSYLVEYSVEISMVIDVGLFTESANSAIELPCPSVFCLSVCLSVCVMANHPLLSVVEISGQMYS